MIFVFSEYSNTTKSQGFHISNYSCIKVTTIASWTHGILEIGRGNTVQFTQLTQHPCLIDIL